MSYFFCCHYIFEINLLQRRHKTYIIYVGKGYIMFIWPHFELEPCSRKINLLTFLTSEDVIGSKCSLFVRSVLNHFSTYDLSVRCRLIRIHPCLDFHKVGFPRESFICNLHTNRGSDKEGFIALFPTIYILLSNQLGWFWVPTT